METKVIEIKGATIVSTSGNPADPEPTTVLVIEAPITVAMADVLKCRYLYTLNDQPVKFEGAIKLPLELGEDEAELALEIPGGGKNTMRPLKIHNFKITHENDVRLSMEFRTHFKGAAESQVVNDFLHAVNKGEFTCWVGSTQGELFTEATKGDGPAGGTRVEMSGAKQGGSVGGPLLNQDSEQDTGCTSCNNNLPFTDDSRTKHLNGVKCTATPEPVAPTAAEKKAARLEEERKKRAAREEAGAAIQ